MTDSTMLLTVVMKHHAGLTPDPVFDVDSFKEVFP